MDEKTLLDLASHSAEGYYSFIEAIHSYHVSGFADYMGTLFPPPTPEQLEQLELVYALHEQLPDDELRTALRSLREYEKRMIEIDGKIVDWLAAFVGISSFERRRDRKQLARLLHKIVAEGPDGRPQGPVWAMSQEYKDILSESEKVMYAADNAKKQFDLRLAGILSSRDESDHDAK